MFTKIALVSMIFCVLVNATPMVTLNVNSAPAGTMLQNGAVNIRVMSVDFHAVGENFNLRDLTFGWESGMAWNATLWSGVTQVGNPAGTGVAAGTTTFDFLTNVIIPANGVVTLDVRADIGTDFQGALTPRLITFGGFGASTRSYQMFEPELSAPSFQVGSSVPEPGTCGLIGLGLATLVAARRRFK